MHQIPFYPSPEITNEADIIVPSYFFFHFLTCSNNAIKNYESSSVFSVCGKGGEVWFARGHETEWKIIALESKTDRLLVGITKQSLRLGSVRALIELVPEHMVVQIGAVTGSVGTGGAGKGLFSRVRA